MVYTKYYFSVSAIKTYYAHVCLCVFHKRGFYVWFCGIPKLNIKEKGHKIYNKNKAWLSGMIFIPIRLNILLYNTVLLVLGNCSLDLVFLVGWLVWSLNVWIPIPRNIVVVCLYCTMNENCSFPQFSILGSLSTLLAFDRFPSFYEKGKGERERETTHCANVLLSWQQNTPIYYV